MKILIRSAKKSDIPAIVALNKKLALFHKKLFPYSEINTATSTTYRSWLNASLKKKTSKIFVAERDNQIFGFIWGRFSKPAKNIISPKVIGVVQDMFVEEKFREKGMGKLLWANLQKWFGTNRVVAIELGVYSRNKRTIKFWESLGFGEYLKTMKIDLD